MVWRREHGCILVCLGLSLFAAAGCGETVADDAPAPTGGSAGSATSSQGGSTNTMETGGTGGLPVTMESGGTTTPAASGVSLALSPVLTPNSGRLCNAGTTGAFTYQIGEPAPGKTIESGMQGVVVSCAVEIDAAGNTQLNATISGVDANGHKPMALSVTSQIDAGDAMPSATLTFISPDVGSLTTLTDYPACTLGPITVLKSGAILADMDCPVVGSLDDASSGCRAHGTIAFEYCATGRPPASGDDPPSGP